MENLSFTLCLVTLMHLTVQAQETIRHPHLALLLDSMVTIDQGVQNNIIAASKARKSQEEMKQLYKVEYEAFERHQPILKKIVQQYGFPGFNQVGKKGSESFWLLVQHCDSVPSFQQYVLQLMKRQIKKGNADPINYAYLIDRVNLNTGKSQVYGTQVMYENRIALPKKLIDAKKVDKRRLSIGLGTLQTYLDAMTHFYQETNPN